MKGLIKKQISLVLLTLIIISALFSTISCARNRAYDETEVVTAAKALIEKSILLNEIYYGDGIPYIKDESYSEGSYYVANYFALDEYGIDTVSDIERMTRDVFSTSLSSAMISATLASIYEGDDITIYQRYYQSYDPLTDEPIDIMVYSDATVLLTDDVVYDYESLKTTGSVGEVVYVEIKATATNAEGRSSVNTLSIGLIEQADGWRLNTPTYTSYVDLDYYNDLQNK